MKVGEAHALFGQSIQMGRLDPAVVATKVAVPQVVGHDDNQVGTILVRRRGSHLKSGRTQQQHQDGRMLLEQSKTPVQFG